MTESVPIVEGARELGSAESRARGAGDAEARLRASPLAEHFNAPGGPPPEKDELVCIDNIGPRGRRQRFWSGIFGYAVTGGIAAWLYASGMRGPVWLALFVPLMIAGVGVFQSFEKT